MPDERFKLELRESDQNEKWEKLSIIDTIAGEGFDARVSFCREAKFSHDVSEDDPHGRRTIIAYLGWNDVLEFRAITAFVNRVHEEGYSKGFDAGVEDH